MPGPLPESRRRAYLAAMGIPVWLPRDASADAPASMSDAMPEPAADPPAHDSVSRRPASSPPGPLSPHPVTQSGDNDTGGNGAGDIAATAVSAMDWETLRASILRCEACELCGTRTRAVPGVGDTTADLMVVGEAPGREEDRQGEPFVGRAGQLLDRMLAAIGLDRQHGVYITNVLKCRPPDNRDPRPDEARACAPYLHRQIELIQPKVILSVGRVSAQNLLESATPLGKLRGRWHRFGPRETPLLVTYHPAYLLRTPAAKRQAWTDLKQVRDRLRIP